ncbi:hypothetical protein KCP76_21190 [Salmonella enterica subsp. enterica serovar Weltevreden]|nr:hypothetical protein KCP76_21190 [Salmonella enterica subsp. enterica serovar Weltevreden]
MRTAEDNGVELFLQPATTRKGGKLWGFRIRPGEAGIFPFSERLSGIEAET